MQNNKIFSLKQAQALMTSSILKAGRLDNLLYKLSFFNIIVSIYLEKISSSTKVVKKILLSL